MRPSSRKRSTASFVGTSSSESFRDTTATVTATGGVYVPPSDRPSSAMRRPRPSAAAESASSANPSTRSARFATPPSVSVRSTHTSTAAAPVQQSLSAPRADSRAEDSDEDSLYDEGIERENAVAQAKNDLLQLGIELDDDIIERLQKNLKIEKIFHIARQASKIVTKKASADADRSMEQEMLYYRNTTTQPSPQKTTPHNAQAHIAAVAGDHPIKSILNPKIAIQYDERHAVELLQKLENGRADIEPQHRPVAEMAIEKFRLQYARYPDKFICRLLGQKYPTIVSMELAKKRLNSKSTAPNVNKNATDNNNNNNNNNTNIPTAEKEAVPATESNALANTASMSVKSSTSRKYSTSSAAAVVTSSSTANNTNEKAQPKEATATSAAQPRAQAQSQPAQKTTTMQRAATQSAINEQIMEWILQKRYLIQSEFQTMIQRVLPSHMQDNEEIALILFSLLAETKKLAPNQRKKRVVDLWGFLTLLKVASDESRRSYDAKTSRLATDIEFWRRDNGKHVVLSEENGPLLSNLTQKPGKINTKQYTDYSQDPVKILIDPSQAPSKNTTFPAKKNSDGRIIHSISTTVWPENKSVAQLINQPNHEHVTKATQGRCILGYIAQETTNVCDVPTALHSPKRTKTPQKSHYSDRAMQRDNNLPLVTSTELLDSRKVAYLLGQEELVSKLRNHNGDDNNKPRASSVNRFRREHFDNTSMACAFGRPDSAFPPPPPVESHHTRKSKEHPIAGYVSGKTQSRPMWMKEPHSMHWENQRPSVAAALGGNANYLHNNRIS